MADEERQQRRLGSRRTQARTVRRHRAQRRRTRRNLYIGFGGGAVALALIVGLFLPSVQLFSGGSPDPNPTGTPTPTSDLPTSEPVGTLFPSLGREHVREGTSLEYNSTPPTSGSHYNTPADWGVYESQQPDGAVVHNLEHGGINVSHNLTDEAEIAALRTFLEGQRTFPGCFVMHPHADIAEGTVALTSWQWLEEFDGVATAGMQEFINTHINRAPEHLGPDCGFAAQMDR